MTRGEETLMNDAQSDPIIRVPPPGPKARALLARDDQYISPSYTRAYPLVAASGSGAMIEDVDGNRYLDFTAGIAVVATGHCHPAVVRAINDQSSRLLHMSGTDFYYQPQIDLAERLAKLAPGPKPKKVFFTNSGAEAVEAALKLARYNTGRQRVIAFIGAFHGRTFGAMSLSGSKLQHRRGFEPLVPEIHHVPYGDCDWIENKLFRHIAPPEEVAAVFVEPIQGEGGYIVPPPEFHPRLRQICDRHKILLVADEVQSGMGRTGRMFAMEHWNIVPDIVCLAKGIASGMPLGAMIASTDVMNWKRGSHASTFGGNPVSCRAALATLDLLESEFIANAHDRGVELVAGLRDLASRNPLLGEVRGLGLMVGADVLAPNGSSEAPSTFRDQIVQEAFQRGLLLLGCGDRTLRFCPPLCITTQHVQSALRILKQTLDHLAPAPMPDEAAPCAVG
jgi:4-aminobutyrate aminotransferase